MISIGRDIRERVHPPYSQSVHCVRAAPELSRYCYHGDSVRGCTRRNSAYCLSARALGVNASLARNDERGSLKRCVHACGIQHRVNAGKYPRIVYRNKRGGNAASGSRAGYPAHVTRDIRESRGIVYHARFKTAKHFGVRSLLRTVNICRSVFADKRIVHIAGNGQLRVGKPRVKL